MEDAEGAFSALRGSLNCAGKVDQEVEGRGDYGQA